MQMVFENFPYEPRHMSCSLYRPGPLRARIRIFFLLSGSCPGLGMQVQPLALDPRCISRAAGGGSARGPAENDSQRAGWGEHLSLPAHVLIQNVPEGLLALLDDPVWVMGLGS